MSYKYQDVLRSRAQQFAEALLRDQIQARILEDTFRDYTVRMAIARQGEEQGSVNLYYSPRRDAFTCKTHQIKNDELASTIEERWHALTNGDAAEGQTDDTDGLRAYVDGSYVNGRVGYGAVLLHCDQEVQRLSGLVEEGVESHQVAGELAATLAVLDWCREHDVRSVDIYYDHQGIERWARGQWKANKPLTRRYAARVRESPVKVRWHKVKSHSGDRWNDVADKPAYQAAANGQHANGASPRPGNGHRDEMQVLAERAAAFADFLMGEGIDAEFDSIQNNQYARILIHTEAEKPGFFDLYHTARKPYSPYIHRLEDPALRRALADLWQEFHMGV